MNAISAYILLFPESRNFLFLAFLNCGLSPTFTSFSGDVWVIIWDLIPCCQW
ncbi:hypothetical protein CLOSTASPAR_03604 [[Clostridium] asparagiforme DSM 15981]|uniref:Uncharacterized protein n=1 Tax=[Clostridium] asparagiforme DSM 15981 TaxID=518636 RepID=C0D2W5_9FIRM|nr:hypothetical protein CLOSTASPAR_03604 [[Clostridium] asparagiforme DSM 15981]